MPLSVLRPAIPLPRDVPGRGRRRPHATRHAAERHSAMSKASRVGSLRAVSPAGDPLTRVGFVLLLVAAVILLTAQRAGRPRVTGA